MSTFSQMFSLLTFLFCFQKHFYVLSVGVLSDLVHWNRFYVPVVINREAGELGSAVQDLLVLSWSM